MNNSMNIRQNSILLLNRNFQFLNIISLKTFLRLWSVNKIEVVKFTDKEWVLHPRIKMKYPSVAVMKYMVKAPYRDIKLSRESIIRRDGCVCQYTGKKLKRSEVEIDHVIPRSRGGMNTWENLVVSSRKSNNTKGNRTPEEAGMKLIRKPRKPHLHEILQDFDRDDWREFLGY